MKTDLIGEALGKSSTHTDRLRHYVWNGSFKVITKSLDDLGFVKDYTELSKALKDEEKEAKPEEEKGFVPAKFDHGEGLKHLKGRRMRAGSKGVFKYQQDNNRRKLSPGEFVRPPYEDEV